MKIAITGGYGLRGCGRLRALEKVEPVRLGRADFADPDLLVQKLNDVDAVIHIAGVNGAESDEAVEQGNIALARTLAEALAEVGKPAHVVYANSVQAELDNPYGRGKRAPSTGGSIIMTGLDAEDVVRGVGIAMADGAVTSSHPAGHEIHDTSNRVVRFISSTAERQRQWAGIRGN